MSAEYFNSLGGFSVGIPEIPVIDANGNVITNVLTNGNVFANVVYATYYRYANGSPLTVTPGGSNTQLQYNNNGTFAGIPNVTFNGNILSLGDVSSLKILGGQNGYFLQTDGEGNLTWAAGGNGGGNGSPGGANTQVQFNDSGSFGGDAGFVYNKNTNVLTVENIVVNNSFVGNVSFANTAATVTSPAQPNSTSFGTLTGFTVSGTLNANSITGNGAGISNINGSNIIGPVASANSSTTAATVTNNSQPNITSVGTLIDLSVTGNVVAGNVYANSGTIGATFLDGTLTTSSQPNITNVGILTSLTTSGNIAASGNITGGNANVTGRITAANLAVTGNITFSNSLIANANANVNFAVASTVNLGSLSNVKISGGDNGYVLSTDGAGNLSWTAAGGGNGAPGGSNTQIQYNDNGTFGGSPFLTFNEVTNTVNVSGNLVANTLIMGSGAYRFSYSNVYSATTSSTVANQIIYNVPAEDVAGIDLTVITTDLSGGSRQLSKLTTVIIGSTLSYVDVSTIAVNDYLSEFSMVYDAGNVITPPQIILKVSPLTGNLLTHKMQITTYEE